jgi:hypothetical protein
LVSHIDGFFPRTVQQDPDIVRQRLNELFTALHQDVAAIRAYGRFSQGLKDWFVCLVQSGPDRPMEIEGEGPYGFGINVYDRTVRFTSAERFGAIAYPEFGIAQPLRRVFRRVASALGTPGPFAVVSAGYGETDKACDRAYYQGATLEQVCECLEEINGPPVRSWEGLEAGQRAWYLGEAG